MNILAPSLLAVDYCNIESNIREIEKAGVNWLHLDVMDGYFVPNISFGEPVISCIRKITDLYFDVHMMVIDPIRYIDDYAKAGADSITVHYEACEDLAKAFSAIKAHGLKVGVSINPETPVSVLEPYMQDVDLILIMSVQPGFGGQAFKEESIKRLQDVRTMISNSGRDIKLQVDGGIKHSNVKRIVDAGADVIVSGSAVFSGNIQENVKTFMEIMNP